MAYREFTGELEGAPPPKTVRPFTGELEAAVPVAPPPDATPWLSEAQAGHPAMSGLMGLATPAVAVAQLVGGPETRKLIAEFNAKRARGRTLQGREGFDWTEFVASLLPGGMIAKGVSKALPAAKTAWQAIGLGGAQGAALGALQPTSAPEEDFAQAKLRQTLTSGLVGAAVPAVAEGTKAFLGQTTLTPQAAQTLAEGRKAGYVVPPSRVNPGGLNTRLESVAGKAAVTQEAAARNQAVTNRLAARAVGLPPDQPISEAVLNTVRKKAGTVYDEVAKTSPVAQQALEELKQARFDANLQHKFYARSGNPEAYVKAQDASLLAEKLEQTIAQEATTAGKPDLVRRLAEARTRIAKTYDVERALNLGTGEVSAPVLGRLLDTRGEKALTGELGTVGKMAAAFPSSMREGAVVPSAGVSGTDAAMSAVLGTLGYGAGGPPGLAAAALPLARPLARHGVLSPFYQQQIAPGLTPHGRALIEAIQRRLTVPAAIGAAQQF